MQGNEGDNEKIHADPAPLQSHDHLVFDNLLNLEEQFFHQGKQQGIEYGKTLGTKEGTCQSTRVTFQEEIWVFKKGWSLELR